MVFRLHDVFRHNIHRLPRDGHRDRDDPGASLEGDEEQYVSGLLAPATCFNVIDAIVELHRRGGV
jgi:hypothetical protein